MSSGVNNGATTIPAAIEQPVQLATPATSGSVAIHNETGNDAIYVGGSTVDSSTGFPVAAAASISFDIGDVGALYVAGTEGDVVRWVSTTTPVR